MKWRPKNNGKSNVNVQFCIKDLNGDYYSLDEEDEVEMGQNPREYKAAGVAFEVLCPMKRCRLKVRGYLKKNGKELVYARIRLLWIALSNGFDMSYHFDDVFLAKEITNSSTSGNPSFEVNLRKKNSSFDLK